MTLVMGPLHPKMKIMVVAALVVAALVVAALVVAALEISPS